MKTLTKSRFKLALECPTKLHYTGKSKYANQKLEDDFLESLAQGGFQVEEMAKLYYPNGVLIEGYDEEALIKTNKQLKKENVVLFEPAFQFQNLLVRVDILVKKGNVIELIEVKAKSIDPHNDYNFIGKRGGLVSSWKSYLYDVAFQKYVMQQANPNWNITANLLLANKNAIASVDGLNQKFRISKNATTRTGIVYTEKLTKEDLGTPLLKKIDINAIIQGIIKNQHKIDERFTFEELIQFYATHYEKEIKINTPISKACKTCEFKTNGEQKLSGFVECWKHQLNWTDTDFEQPKVYDIANFRSANKLMEQGKIVFSDITEDDIPLKEVAGKLSQSERQWLQIEKELNQDTTPHFELESLKEEMASWKYPLNFIDFETSAVAIPFNKGRKPYEQVAFQFSHHIVYENGKIEQASEFICAEAGKFPNFEFIRALKKALSQNNGSIFKFANHENSILNAIHEQLTDSELTDKEELMGFIQLISHSKNDSVLKWEGDRDMIDLCQVVKDYYYSPYTKGSNSIKYVLPAVLNESAILKTKYAKPLGEIDVTSKNFGIDMIFISIENNEVINPYKQLPPLFEDWSEEELDNVVSELDSSIANGGMALMAYAKLQYEDLPEKEKKEIIAGLLKYCELDTLAMVMIYEYFKDVVNG